MCIHANGDLTIDMVLTAYEKAQAAHPRPDPRHRIEHCTLVNPDLLRRMKALGWVATPFCTYVYHHGEKMPFFGEERLEWMFAQRSFIDYGVVSTGATDYPPGPFEPLLGHVLPRVLGGEDPQDAVEKASVFLKSLGYKRPQVRPLVVGDFAECTGYIGWYIRWHIGRYIGCRFRLRWASNKYAQPVRVGSRCRRRSWHTLVGDLLLGLPEQFSLSICQGLN